MAKTKTDIANLVLMSLGLYEVTDIDQADDLNSRAIARVYDEARRFVLSEANWGFATKTSVFVYDAQREGFQVPSDCIKILGQVSSSGLPIPLTSMQECNGVLNLYYGDIYPTKLIASSTLSYIYDCIDVARFPSGFISALRDYIASLVAVSLTGDQNKRLLAENSYRVSLGKAINKEASQFKPFYSRARLSLFRQN